MPVVPALQPVPIRTLSLDTRNLLGSTLLLPDVPSILVALVNNALASQPRRIRIELQLTQDSRNSSWPSVTCSDDGSGFSQAWCEDTRKFDHGTLASVAKAGNLELLTRPHIGGRSADWWSIVTEHGFAIYSGPLDKANHKANMQHVLKLSPFSSGSSVRVSDIFTLVPVRRKLLASSANEAQSACVRALQTVALRAAGVSFELVAHAGGKTTNLLTLRSSDKQVTRCIDVLGTSIDDHQEIEATVALESSDQAKEHHSARLYSSTTESVHVRGLLILSPVARNGRVIFWGNTLLAEESEEGEALHACLNKLLARTLSKYDAVPLTASRRPGYVLELDVRAPLDKFLGMPTEGQSTDRRALFHIVASSLERILGDAMRERGILPPLQTARKRNLDETHADIQPIDKEQLQTRTPAVQRFKKYKRPRSSFGDRVRSIGAEQHAGQCHSTPGPSTKAVFAEQGPIPFDTTPASALIAPQAKPRQIEPLRSMVDVLGRSFVVKPRTGSSSRPNLSSFRLPSTPVSGNAEASRAAPSWLLDAIKEWNDPVLPAPAEQPIAQVAHAPTQGAEASLVSLLEGADLEKATVLGQIEKKFVACVLPRNQSDRCLALVDQHAADERIRFESFLRPFLQVTLTSSMTPDSFAIPNPLLLKLSAPHVQTLLEPRSQAALARWGFSLAPCESIDEAKAYISVQAVPSLLRDRLTSEDASLEDVLVDVGSWLDDGGAKMLEAARAVLERRKGLPHSPEGGERPRTAEHEWMHAMRHLPASLLRLIASKACRGAVMFGDPLERQQCERLITELSRTALPLQCAHDLRPSRCTSPSGSPFNARWTGTSSASFSVLLRDFETRGLLKRITSDHILQSLVSVSSHTNARTMIFDKNVV